MANTFSWFRMPTFGKAPAKQGQTRNISSLISAFQFSRLKHDILGWRDAISEAELAFYPQRVKMQRIFMDTIINGHVHACVNRRNNLVLLKDFGLFSGETEDVKATELFRKQWFFDFLRHGLEAKYYGYSLIKLDDLINNEFPYLDIVPRENVSPDREVLSSIVYQLSGEPFNDPSSEFYDWVVWVPTPSDKGTSSCGYGLFYKIANYEIFLRNLLGQNATYNDNYGQPFRHGKTTKQEGKEYDEFCKMLDEMGENAWAVTDPSDEIEFVTASQGNSAGWKTYENFEARLEKKISKVILGHSDALDSTPGKIGGGQNGEESPVAQALEDLETADSRDMEYIINGALIPKLIRIGFPVKPGLVFKFKNDKEKEEIKEKKDDSIKKVSEYVKTLSDAGYSVDDNWLTEHTGIKLTKKEAPDMDPLTIKKIENLYRL